MIEKLVLDWLTARGYAAYTTVPRERPAVFVSIEATGGGGADMVATPLLTVDCWAASRGQACALADEVKCALLQDTRAGNVAGVGLAVVNAEPYWAPDPDSRAPRYRMLFEITHA